MANKHKTINEKSSDSEGVLGDTGVFLGTGGFWLATGVVVLVLGLVSGLIYYAKTKITCENDNISELPGKGNVFRKAA